MVLELTAPVRALAVRAAACRTDIDHLPVLGHLPVSLDGALRQFVPHPGRRVPGGCQHMPDASFTVGVRLSGGTARWHREERPRPALRPTLPATARVRDTAPGVAVAHPVLDPVGAELHTVSVYPGLPFAEHLAGTPDGLQQRSEPFPLEGAPLVHTIAVTERWVLVLDLPVTYRESAVLVGAATAWRWTPGRPARIGLLPRDGGAPPRWFEIAPCFVYHVANAYEVGDTVVVDAVRHERAFDPAGAAGAPLLWRWQLDLRTGAVREHQLADAAAELPAVDGRTRGRRPGAVWTVEQRRDASVPAAGPALVRYDASGDCAVPTARHGLGPGRLAGEPVFVPAGRAVADGDGWLLVPVGDALTDRTELLVLDATELIPVAAVLLPVGLPTGLHGDWQPC